jgi:hypothetical protein
VIKEQLGIFCQPLCILRGGIDALRDLSDIQHAAVVTEFLLHWVFRLGDQLIRATC